MAFAIHYLIKFRPHFSVIIAITIVLLLIFFPLIFFLLTGSSIKGISPIEALNILWSINGRGKLLLQSFISRVCNNALRLEIN